MVRKNAERTQLPQPIASKPRELVRRVELTVGFVLRPPPLGKVGLDANIRAVDVDADRPRLPESKISGQCHDRAARLGLAHPMDETCIRDHLLHFAELPFSERRRWWKF